MQRKKNDRGLGSRDDRNMDDLDVGRINRDQSADLGRQVNRSSDEPLDQRSGRINRDRSSEEGGSVGSDRGLLDKEEEENY